MTLLRDYHGHAYTVTSPDDAGHRFDEQTETIMPHGRCGQTLTIGTDDQPVLRIDTDTDQRPTNLHWKHDNGSSS